MGHTAVVYSFTFIQDSFKFLCHSSHSETVSAYAQHRHSSHTARCFRPIGSLKKANPRTHHPASMQTNHTCVPACTHLHIVHTLEARPNLTSIDALSGAA